MARVIPYLLDGEFRRGYAPRSRGQNTSRARYVHHVEELSGTASGRLIQAADAPGIPRIGDAHPTQSGLTVETVEARATSDPTRAEVTVTYSGTDGGDGGTPGSEDLQISIRAELITEVTVENVNGQIMTTSYAGLGTFSVQTHRVEVQRPTHTLVFSRIEDASARVLAASYNGTVNEGPFQGQPRDTYLASIESESESDGRHRVRYSFAYNPNGWQAKLTAAPNGLIPIDASIQNGGIRIEQVYERRNFNTFGLPLA